MLANKQVIKRQITKVDGLFYLKIYGTKLYACLSLLQLNLKLKEAEKPQPHDYKNEIKTIRMSIRGVHGAPF